jgi:uncharacterized membrane protein (DUF373 family)
MKKIVNLIQPILIWFLLFGLTVYLDPTSYIFSFISESWGPVVLGALLNLILLAFFFTKD